MIVAKRGYQACGTWVFALVFFAYFVVSLTLNDLPAVCSFCNIGKI